MGERISGCFVFIGSLQWHEGHGRGLQTVAKWVAQQDAVVSTFPRNVDKPTII